MSETPKATPVAKLPAAKPARPLAQPRMAQTPSGPGGLLARRTRRDFTVELVLQILLDQRLVSEAQKRELQTKEPAQRARLGKREALGGVRHEVSPIELVASFQLPLPTRAGRTRCWTRTGWPRAWPARSACLTRRSTR